MLHHNWDTCQEGKAQNAICPHNKETWAVSESRKAALWKWFLLRSERCQRSHEVKEWGYSREKKWHWYRALAISENIEWEELTWRIGQGLFHFLYLSYPLRLFTRQSPLWFLVSWYPQLFLLSFLFSTRTNSHNSSIHILKFLFSNSGHSALLD